jgi:flavin reductase (DIM6/NTAB) family NADH-FMN oxidoreductase RutF
MILWCLDKVSDLYQEIINLDNYVINFLSDSQKEVAQLLSQKNDHSLGSINCIQDEKGMKIKDCIGWISCSKDKSIDSGDHSILIANVIGYNANKGNPLIFWEGSYRSISD